MPNVIKVACATALPLLICACQSYSTPPLPPATAQCQPPPPPAEWFMGERAPDLTLRMLNELSTSPMPATKD
jgi:hypothetical protein